MNKLLLVILFFSCVSLKAQNDVMWNTLPINGKQYIQVENQINLYSDFITYDLLSDTWNNSYFDSNEKEELFNQLDANNNFFYDLNNEVHWRNNTNDSIRGLAWKNYIFTLQDRWLAYGNIATPVVQLALNGNQSFVGQQTNINKNSFTFFHYNSLKIGRQLRFIKNNWIIKTRPQMGILAGNNFNSILIDNSQFYISNTADSIHAQISFEQRKAVQTSKMGLGVCFDFETTVQNGDHLFKINMQDLGQISWANNQHELNIIDTSIRFKGIEIQNLLSNDTSLNTEINLNQRSSLVKQKVVLPTQINLGYEHKFSDQYTLKLNWLNFPMEQFNSLLYFGNELSVSDLKLEYGVIVFNNDKTFHRLMIEKEHIGNSFWSIKLANTFSPSYQTLYAGELITTFSF